MQSFLSWNSHRVNGCNSALHQCVITYSMVALWNHLSDRGIVGRRGVLHHTCSPHSFASVTTSKGRTEAKGNASSLYLTVNKKTRWNVSPNLKVLCKIEFSVPKLSSILSYWYCLHVAECGKVFANGQWKYSYQSLGFRMDSALWAVNVEAYVRGNI